MAIKAQAQQTLIDLTDAYSVMLTSEAYTFPGSINAAKAGSCSTQVLAYRGSTQVAATVNTASLTLPTGITVSADTTTDPLAPILTFTASTSFTTAAEISIPVNVTSGGDTLTITKKFSLSIAYTGETGATGAGGIWYTGTTITGTSATAAVFSSSGITSAKVGDMYLNTSTYNTYRCTTGGASSTAKWVYVNNIKGATGETGAGGVWYSGTAITGTSTTATIFSSSGISSAKVGDMYLNTSTSNTYRCTTGGAASAAKWVYVSNIKGAKGDDGDDAYNLVITSSNGLIFKNTQIATVLTAHVYLGGVELGSNTTPTLASAGTIKWYKDGASTAVATGQTLSISAGDVTNSADYVATLEG